MEKIARHYELGTAPKVYNVGLFNADVSDGMQWKFTPTQREGRVKPGERTLAFYNAENKSSAPITGVSTYNVTTMKVYKLASVNDYQVSTSLDTFFIDFQIHIVCFRAVVYFNKIQCFYFEEQRILPGEQIDMPVFFYTDHEFETDPKMDEINNLILSYTFFKVSEENTTDPTALFQFKKPIEKVSILKRN
ncbi:unnamed protein product [Eruca vesicaria subsp. sativa]|uniref:Uncharacterized protein n=1 Tax=Eruca vesicaria subsp. sativa TaxID=29727 RepID=A0ABC8KD18_ERUVS|nr:unnamed protein product [Eruca vesicaria subsp. sativa]